MYRFDPAWRQVGAADLVYHLMVLLASVDVTPTEVWNVLEQRHAPKKG